MLRFTHGTERSNSIEFSLPLPTSSWLLIFANKSASKQKKKKVSRIPKHRREIPDGEPAPPPNVGFCGPECPGSRAAPCPQDRQLEKQNSRNSDQNLGWDAGGPGSGGLSHCPTMPFLAWTY